MSIKQFNGSYSQNDDRIFFRFNTIDHNEFKFWFTRRVTHLILSAAHQFSEKSNQEDHTPSVAKAISEFQQQAIKDTTNLFEQYEPGTQFPIGSDPVVVMDAKCEISQIENQDIFSLDFILPGGGTINLKLPVPIMQKLVLLLDQLNTHAKWGEPANISLQQLSEKSFTKKIH